MKRTWLNLPDKDNLFLTHRPHYRSEDLPLFHDHGQAHLPGDLPYLVQDRLHEQSYPILLLNIDQTDIEIFTLVS